MQQSKPSNVTPVHISTDSLNNFYMTMRARIVERRKAFLLQQENNRQERLIHGAPDAFEKEKADMAEQGYTWDEFTQKFWVYDNEQHGYVSVKRKEQVKIEAFNMLTDSNKSDEADTAVYTVNADDEIGISIAQSMDSNWTTCFTGFTDLSFKQKQAAQASTNNPEKSLFMESGMMLKTINGVSQFDKSYQQIRQTIIQTVKRPLTLEFGYVGNDLTRLNDDEIRALAETHLAKYRNHTFLYSFLRKVYKDIPQIRITDDFDIRDVTQQDAKWHKNTTCSYASSINVFVKGGQFVDHVVTGPFDKLGICLKRSDNINWPACFDKYDDEIQSSGVEAKPEANTEAEANKQEERLRQGMVLISINGNITSGRIGSEDEYQHIINMIQELPKETSATLCFATTGTTIIENATVVVNPPHLHKMNPTNRQNRLNIYDNRNIHMYKLSASNKAVQCKWAAVMETRAQLAERQQALSEHFDALHSIPRLTAAIQERVDQQQRQKKESQQHYERQQRRQHYDEQQRNKTIQINLFRDERYALFKKYAMRPSDVPGNLIIKEPVFAATTFNVTFPIPQNTTAFDNSDTSVGTTFTNNSKKLVGKRILLAGQNNKAENGVYIMPKNGGISSADARSFYEPVGTFFFVEHGINSGEAFICDKALDNEFTFTKFSTTGRGGITQEEIEKLNRMFTLLRDNSYISTNSSGSGTTQIYNPEYGILSMINKIRISNTEIENIKRDVHTSRLQNRDSDSDNMHLSSGDRELQQDIKLNIYYYDTDELKKHLAYLRKNPHNRLHDMA